MSTVSRHYVGIDLHLRVVQVCVLDGDGELVEEVRIRIQDPMGRRSLFAFLKQWRRGGRYAVEALGLNRWFVDRCLREKLSVVVVDPSKLGLKKSGKKTDRRDAYEIARRLWLGDIDRNATTYYPTEVEYGARRTIRVRHFLVQRRHQVLLQIRSLLRSSGITEPLGNLRTRKGLEALKGIELPYPDLTALLRVLIPVLEQMESSVEALGRQIKAYADDTQIGEVAMLPSVGPQTAATLVYELGDVTRFKGTRAVAAYGGLAPRVEQSGDRAHHGRITRRGNRELRWILGQWAVRLMASDPLVQRWAAPRLRRMPKGKVRVALARRLLIGVYVMLRRNEAFSLEKCLAA